MARNKYPVLFNEEQSELRASQVGDIYHQMRVTYSRRGD